MTRTFLTKAVVTASTAFALTVLPGAAAAMWSGEHASYSEAVATHGADTIAVGELHLFNRRALETPPNARNAGGFLSIYNYSSEPNRLVSASSPIAERVELHTMTMENDVMRMRELEDGIELPANAQVDLEPGGLHVMFINLSQPFVEGEEVQVTLTFANGDEQEIVLPVRARTMEITHGEGHESGDGHGSHH